MVFVVADWELANCNFGDSHHNLEIRQRAYQRPILNNFEVMVTVTEIEREHYSVKVYSRVIPIVNRRKG